MWMSQSPSHSTTTTYEISRYALSSSSRLTAPVLAGPRWHAYNKRTCRGKVHVDVGSCNILVITTWPGLERRCCLKALLGSCHASFVTDYARAIWLECNNPVAKLGLLLACDHLCVPVCVRASAFMAVSGFRTQAHVSFFCWLVKKRPT